MTKKLYDENSYLKEFEAKVLSCDKTDEVYKIVLDKTAFFPEGGGQPADKGEISGQDVLDVQIEDEVIFHYLKSPLNVGDTVKGEIDFDTRYDRMQNHSGEHIISGIVNSLYGYENVGFHLSDETVTLDFNGILDDVMLRDVELRANKVVWNNVKIRGYYPDDDTLKNLSYRSKKELSGAIRIVEIEGCDRCACCAPHVKSSGEIGVIKMLSTEKIRGGTRIFIKCGKRALDDYAERVNVMSKVSNLMALKPNEIFEGTEKLYSNLYEIKGENTNLQKRLINVLISKSLPEDYLLLEEGFSVKELQLLADSLYKKHGMIRGAFSNVEASTYSFAICGEETLLNDFFARFKDLFKVRGGGRNGMVQGTVEGNIEEIKSFFKF
ncbi:MAG: alanyl-tRNA editing protein [Oscillospiraceae bacterium]|nr:alanyl-tRNA editing protein [Oscillospiraceae bacterium]